MAQFTVTFRAEPVELYHFDVEASNVLEARRLVNDYAYVWGDCAQIRGLFDIETLEDQGAHVVEVLDEAGDVRWSGIEGAHNDLA